MSIANSNFKVLALARQLFVIISENMFFITGFVKPFLWQEIISILLERKGKLVLVLYYLQLLLLYTLANRCPFLAVLMTCVPTPISVIMCSIRFYYQMIKI